MVDQCSNCDYYRTRAYGSNTVGECRVIEPETQGQKGQWPEVKGTDWCGEWEAIDSHRKDTYIRGNVNLTTATPVLLMGVEGDTTFTTAVMAACQLSNLANQNVVVFFYDGNDIAEIITQVGCGANVSHQIDFPHPLGAFSGEIWCALNAAATSVYVSAQGQKVRP